MSIHTGVSIQRCRRFLRRGHEKKRPKKKRVGFSVWVFWATEKPTLKSRVLVAKNRKKNDRKKRLSVFDSQPWLLLSVACDRHFHLSRMDDALIGSDAAPATSTPARQIHKTADKYLDGQVTARNNKHVPPTKTFVGSAAAILVAMRCGNRFQW